MPSSEVNHDSFTPFWFETFLDTIPEEMTQSEIDFVARHLPPKVYPYLLDIACGSGRHADGLAALGYQILGIDKDVSAVEKANGKGISGAEFKALDMRRLGELRDGPFDGAINLWHSFGYYDSATNKAVLSAIE